MSENISDAALVKQLRQKFGIRGSPDVALETSVIPVANVGDLDSPPWHSKGGGLFSLGSGPVAAQFPYTGLRALTNLPNNFRAVIRYIAVSMPAGIAITVKIANSATLDATLAGPAVNPIAGSWDSNSPDDAIKRPALLSYQTNNVTAFLGDGFYFGPQGAGATAVILPGPYVLAPGNTIFLQANTVNQGIVASWYWDEYYIS